MKKTTAIKKYLETGKLTTNLLPALGISFESFLRLAQATPEKQLEVEAKLKAKYVAELPRLLTAEKVARKAAKALRDGDIDTAFERGIEAANIADGLAD